jgi:LysR family transcriptional regulator, hydrogen peroxide-inducible genes activator
MQPPSLRQLEYLLAVAEHGTFGAAASALRVSQPALSSQVAEAEQRLGLTVFERGRHGARATPEGEAVLTAARRVLEETHELMRVAAERGGDLAGPLVLGVIPTIAPYLLPAVVRETRRRYPAVELQLREDRTAALLAALRSGTIDLALLAAPIPGDATGIDVVELARDPFVLALPEGHPFAGAGRLPQSALAGLPMLLLEDGHCLREHAADACSIIGASPLGSIQGTSLPSLSQMVAAGMGATLLPASALAVEARSGSGITTRPLRKPEPFRRIALAWRTRSPRADQYRSLAGGLRAPVEAACRIPGRS